ESAVRDGVLRLSNATGRIGSGQFSKAHVVDVRCAGNKGPAWIIHHIDCIQANLQLFSFRNPDALDEVDIEISVRRARDPLPAERADRSGRRIRQNDIAVGVLQSLVRGSSLNALQRRYTADGGVRDLCQATEVAGTTCCICDLAAALGEILKDNGGIGT